MSETETKDLSPLASLMEASWATASSYIMAHPKRELMPQFVAETADGSRTIILAPWQGEADKAATLAMLRVKFTAMDVRRYTLSSETWAAQYQRSVSPEAPGFTMPSQRDDRIEALMVIGVDPESGEILQYYAEIVRQNGRCKLKAREVVPHSSAIVGRMTQLLGPVKLRTVN